jgi:hypothetical protein
VSELGEQLHGRSPFLGANMPDYQYRDGSRIYRGVDATIGAAELDRIRQENGGVLRTRDVVRESMAFSAPLHGIYDWDRDQAAEHWWDHQTRSYIRHLMVRPSGSTKEFRAAYLHVHQPATAVTRQLLTVNYYQDRSEMSDLELKLALQKLERFLDTITKSVEDIRELLQNRGDTQRLELLLIAQNSVDQAAAALSGM